MVSTGLLAVCAILSIAMSVVSVDDDWHWPDFSCLPRNESRHQKGNVNHYKMGWESCRRNYIVNKGSCDKICILWNRDILIRSRKEDPFKFETDTFLQILSDELGITLRSPTEAQEKLVNKVKSGVEGCAKKYPQVGNVTVKKPPCEPYNDFFKCIDTAVGCRKS